MSPSASSWFRTAQGAIRAPWQFAVFWLLVAVATAFIGTLVYAVIALTPLVRWARLARFPLEAWIQLACVLSATDVTAKVLKRENVWTLVGMDYASSSVRRIAMAAAVGLGVIVVPALLLVATGSARFVPSSSADSVAFMVWGAFALLVPAALVEELLFRGFAFSAIREAIGDWGAVAITSALFALAHLLNPSPTVLSIVGVAVAGALLGVVRVVTGSLFAAFAAHLAINAAQLVVLHAPVSGLPFDLPGYRLVPIGPVWLTGGEWGPEGGVAAMTAMLAATFLVSKSAPKRTDNG